MVNAWDSDLVAIDEGLVRLLRGAGHEARSLRHLAEGWDRSVWVVDEQLVAGFPRKAAIVPMIEREIEILPRIAPLLPAPIPVPVLVGNPSDEFPWSFYATRFLPGEEAALVDLDDASRAALGVDLARFLRALHAIELDAELPVDVNGRADMAARAERIREPDRPAWRKRRLGPASGGRGAAERGGRAPAAAPRPPRPRRPLPAQLPRPRTTTERCHRLDRSRPFRPGDRPVVPVERGPADGRDDVAAAYGGLDDAALLRSRVLAVFMGCVILEYAQATDHRAFGAFARDALARTLAD